SSGTVTLPYPLDTRCPPYAANARTGYEPGRTPSGGVTVHRTVNSPPGFTTRACSGPSALAVQPGGSAGVTRTFVAGVLAVLAKTAVTVPGSCSRTVNRASPVDGDQACSSTTPTYAPGGLSKTSRSRVVVSAGNVTRLSALPTGCAGVRRWPGTSCQAVPSQCSSRYPAGARTPPPSSYGKNRTSLTSVGTPKSRPRWSCGFGER